MRNSILRKIALPLLLALFCGADASAATPVTSLPEATSLTGNELFAIDNGDGSAANKLKPTTLRDFVMPHATVLRSCNCNTNEVQINARIAQMIATPSANNVLQLACETYKVTRPIVVLGGINIHIKGCGKGKTIVQGVGGWFDYAINTDTNDAAAIGNAEISGAINFVGTNGFSVSDLTIDYDTYKPINGGNGVVASDLLQAGTGPHAQNGVIQNVEIKGQPGHHYWIWSFRGQNIRINDNDIDGGRSTYDSNAEFGSGHETEVDNNGIEIIGGVNILATRNRIKNVTSACFDIGFIASAPNTNTNGVAATHNTCDKATYLLHLATGYDAGAGITDTRNVLFANNIGTDIWQIGLYGDHQTGDSTHKPTVSNISITRNVLQFAASGSPLMKGVFLKGQTDPTYQTITNYSIDGNQFLGVHPTALTVTPLNYCQYVGGVDITNNLFYTATTDLIGNNASADYTGWRFSGCARNKFNGNTVDGANDSAFDATVSWTDFELKDNLFRNWNNKNNSATGFTGVALTSGTLSRGTVTGNHGATSRNGSIGGSPTPNNPYAFISFGGATADHLIIDDNGGYDGVTAGYWGLSYPTTFSALTHSSIGVLQLTGASAAPTLTNDLIRPGTRVSVQNEAGSTAVIGVVSGAGSAIVKFSQAPGATFSGQTSSGLNTLTASAMTGNITVGAVLSGNANIPAGTTIASGTYPNFVMSANATGTATTATTATETFRYVITK